jgi:uncharacterized OB-fold protein
MPSEAVGMTDADLVETFSRVRVDHDNKAFYRGWLNKRLLLNRCRECGRWHHPPKPICPNCWSSEIEPTEVSGRGTVHLLILLHQGPDAPGVDYAAGPHPVATVELVEQVGLRYTTTIVGIPPGDIHIGMPVELTWIERDGVPFPVFQPASS